MADKFGSQPDRSRDREPEGAATAVEEITEQEAGDSSSASRATPAASRAEPNRQAPDAVLTPSAFLKDEERPSLPVEVATPPLRFEERPPDFDLLAQQLVDSVPHGELQELQDGGVAQYLSLKPQGAIESVISRLIVAGTSASMDSFGRAAQSNESPRARDINLRYGFKGCAVVGDLIRLLQSCRGQGGSKVTVGEVNVAAGGQAIVGHVQTGEPATEDKSPEPLPPTVTNKDDS